MSHHDPLPTRSVCSWVVRVTGGGGERSHMGKGSGLTVTGVQRALKGAGVPRTPVRLVAAVSPLVNCCSAGDRCSAWFCGGRHRRQ